MPRIGDSTGQRVLLVKGSAGLGNRILALLTGLLYARLSSRRVVVDWRDRTYSRDRANAFDHYFRSPSVEPAAPLPDGVSVTPPLWRGRLDLSVDELRAVHGRMRDGRFRRLSTVDLTRLDQPEETAVHNDFMSRVDRLRRHHPGVAPDGTPSRAILAMLLAEQLALDPAIDARVTRFREAHLPTAAVGVHVRHGTRAVRLDAIQARLDALLSERPELRVFLATDNRDVRDALEARYPGAITTPHWYGTPGADLHGAAGCPDRLENGVEALVDLYLLAGCSIVLGDSTSSFFRVARLLAEPRGATVVDVKAPPTLARRVRWVAGRRIGR